jgi:hypothetical protein
MTSLEEQFSNEEIDAIICQLPTNKSPGPDGFCNEFFKKTWSLIKQDFYDHCSAFYNENVCLQSINGSYITLIPKKDRAARISKYRPISLLNSSVKIITELHANRLQKVIMKLIHKNQYGFIRQERSKIVLLGLWNTFTSATNQRKR